MCLCLNHSKTLVTLTITNCALNFFQIVTELILNVRAQLRKVQVGAWRLLNVNAQVYTLRIHSQQCSCTHTSFSCAISMTFGSHSYNIARGGQHEWCMV